MSECIGEGCDHSSHEKVSAWDAAPRTEPEPAKDPELTGLDIDPGRELTPEERAAFPPWVETFRPGRAMTFGGWLVRVVLIDPTRGMLMVHVEGQTKSARKAQARMRNGFTPKHVLRRERNKS